MITKRGQMKMSFGMIFSIILIVIFIVFAFYAISKFLSLSNITQVAKFVDNLQNDIDKIWRGSQGSQQENYFVPGKISLVCFNDFTSSAKGVRRDIYDDFRQINYGSENLFFYPIGSSEGLPSIEIKHIDIAAITQNENPYCFENQKGKTQLTITKDYGEALVKLKR